MSRDFEGGKESLFNEAMFQIQRLHNSWMKCRQYRVSGDYYNWRWELDNIWSELSVDARHMDNEDDWTNNKYNLSIRAIDKMIDVYNSKGRLRDLYLWLDRKEKYLKWIQDKAGKGGSYDDGSYMLS